MWAAISDFAKVVLAQPTASASNLAAEPVRLGQFADRNHFAANELGAVVIVRRPWPAGIAMHALVILSL
jgi:hypothetical protein